MCANEKANVCIAPAMIGQFADAEPDVIPLSLEGCGDNVEPPENYDLPKPPYFPMLSALRGIAVGAVVYHHIVQILGSSSDWEVDRHGQPFVLGILFTISGFLHRFSWRRTAHLGAAYLLGGLLNLLAVYVVFHEKICPGGSMFCNFQYQLWYIPCVWLCSFVWTYFRVSNIVIVVVVLVLGVTKHSHLVWLDLIHAACFASAWILQRRERDGIGSSALPWILMYVPPLGFAVLAIEKQKYWLPMGFFWNYACGAILSQPSRLERLRKQVLYISPWYILAYFVTSAGYTSTTKQINFNIHMNFVERLCMVQGAMWISVAMSAASIGNSILWTSQTARLDRQQFLSYLDHGFFLAAIRYAVPRAHRPLGFGWCLLLANVICFSHWPFLIIFEAAWTRFSSRTLHVNTSQA